MNWRIFLGVILIFFCLVGIAAADCSFYITVPDEVQVPIGGSSTVEMKVKTLDCDSETLQVCYRVDQIDEDKVDARLFGTCTDDYSVCLNSTDWSDGDCLELETPSDGDHYYKLEVKDTAGEQTSAQMGIIVGTTLYNIKLRVIDLLIVPELITAALVGAGLVSIILWNRK